ncbi:MAG: metallopeptidase TldD-related protein, partial [Elusimicrobiota bacterium]
EGTPDYATDDFSREHSISAVAPATRDEALDSDDFIKNYEKILLEQSRRLGTNAKVFRSLIRLDNRRNRVYFLNSEGAELFSAQGLKSVYLSIFGRSRLGLPLHVTKTFYAGDSGDLPSAGKIREAAEALEKSYLELYISSEARAAVAPCLIDSQAAGALFLAFASRLEGERQRDPQEPQTFREKIGKIILPEFLTLEDDPTMEFLDGVRLAGYYLRDEEGVSPRPVTLIDKGVLKSFLLSRHPVKSLPAFSNGHGRASSSSRAHARAANLVVRSSLALTPEEMRQRLIKEVERRKLRFGVRVAGLETIQNEDRTGSHQTMRAAVQMMYFVYPDGHEELVHNGEIVGTPIKLMQSILATGADAETGNFLDNGPSGAVPVSVTAPSLLISEIEVQKGSARSLRPHILPSPLEGS